MNHADVLLVCNFQPMGRSMSCHAGGFREDFCSRPCFGISTKAARRELRLRGWASIDVGELRRRPTEEETEKVVRDNFLGSSETLRTMVLDKEGRSIFDMQIHAKQQKPRDQSIKKFYSDLQDEYFTNLDPTQQFEQPPESDLADERVYGCFWSVLQHNCNFVPVQTYRDEVCKLDTLTLQALLRIAIRILSKGKNDDTTYFLFAAMDFIGEGEYEDTLV